MSEEALDVAEEAWEIGVGMQESSWELMVNY